MLINMAERQHEIRKIYRDELFDDQSLGASGGKDLRHSKSPENVAQNEQFELSKTIKDKKMRSKDVMKSCRTETKPKYIESGYFTQPSSATLRYLCFQNQRR